MVGLWSRHKALNQEMIRMNSERWVQPTELSSASALAWSSNCPEVQADLVCGCCVEITSSFLRLSQSKCLLKALPSVPDCKINQPNTFPTVKEFGPCGHHLACQCRENFLGLSPEMYCARTALACLRAGGQWPQGRQHPSSLSYPCASSQNYL